MEIFDFIILILTSAFFAIILILNRVHNIYLRRLKAMDDALIGTLQNQMLGANLLKDLASRMGKLEKALEDHVGADLRKIIKEEWRGMN